MKCDWLLLSVVTCECKNLKPVNCERHASCDAKKLLSVVYDNSRSKSNFFRKKLLAKDLQSKLKLSGCP